MAKLLIPKLYEDKKLSSTEQVFLAIFEAFVQKAPLVQVYTRIDELPEDALDLLAHQFHIEGYELAQSVEEKRNLIKKAIELHRYKGTKYAIKEVLKALGLEGVVKEWFEYGGQPYRFRVEVELLNRGISEQTLQELEDLINLYKNLRSHLDGITAYLTTRNKRPVLGITSLTGELTTVYPYSISEISQNNSVPCAGIGLFSGEVTTIYPGGNP